MPDKRAHRDPHPEDPRFFAPDQWPALQNAVGDVSWLLSRHYTLHAAVALAGDHYQLADRQRLAVMHGACSGVVLVARRPYQVSAESVREPLQIDGYNVLAAIEAALGGAS